MIKQQQFLKNLIKYNNHKFFSSSKQAHLQNLDNTDSLIDKYQKFNSDYLQNKPNLSPLMFHTLTENTIPNVESLQNKLQFYANSNDQLNTDTFPIIKQLSDNISITSIEQLYQFLHVLWPQEVEVNMRKQDRQTWELVWFNIMNKLTSINLKVDSQILESQSVDSYEIQPFKCNFTFQNGNLSKEMNEQVNKSMFAIVVGRLLNFMIESDNKDHGLIANSLTFLYKQFELTEATISETEDEQLEIFKVLCMESSIKPYQSLEELEGSELKISDLKYLGEKSINLNKKYIQASGQLITYNNMSNKQIQVFSRLIQNLNVRLDSETQIENKLFYDKILSQLQVHVLSSMNNNHNVNQVSESLGLIHVNDPRFKDYKNFISNVFKHNSYLHYNKSEASNEQLTNLLKFSQNNIYILSHYNFSQDLYKNQFEIVEDLSSISKDEVLKIKCKIGFSSVKFKEDQIDDLSFSVFNKLIKLDNNIENIQPTANLIALLFKNYIGMFSEQIIGFINTKEFLRFMDMLITTEYFEEIEAILFMIVINLDRISDPNILNLIKQTFIYLNINGKLIHKDLQYKIIKNFIDDFDVDIFDKNDKIEMNNEIVLKQMNQDEFQMYMNGIINGNIEYELKKGNNIIEFENFHQQIQQNDNIDQNLDCEYSSNQQIFRKALYLQKQLKENNLNYDNNFVLVDMTSYLTELDYNQFEHLIKIKGIDNQEFEQNNGNQVKKNNTFLQQSLKYFDKLI